MADHSSPGSMIQAPSHPVFQLQGPFEESMLESVQDDPDIDIYVDPIVRRNTLLEAPVYTRVVAGRWKQKPGERFHPLWKLIAQISFGIHLLAENMAKSEDEVMQILQAHVDEIDGFLERTTEDFDLAQEDIQERLRCLKLPLSHPATFDKMLEDRNFRLSIVEGNEKIEHIVERTTQAMKDSLKDVQKGLDSASCLEIYLQKLSHTWIRQTVEHEAVFVAMLGNVEGWRKAFMSLHRQGGKLGGSLRKLTDIVNEMQARAGEVSRRLLHQARGYGGSHHSQVMGRPAPGGNTLTSRFQSASAKQLPVMPERPPLRQTVSESTPRSQSSMMAPHSRESLRYGLSRSSTPQNEIPATRQVKPGVSPRIIQIGATSQGRVQSMVPSLLESIPSPQDTTPHTTPPLKSLTIDEEEESERFFPPVELPAHVPEETMRHAPMSTQNRLSLSLGLSLGQSSRAEKRTSKFGAPTAALVDLLRRPSSKRSSALPQAAASRSPRSSRKPSLAASNAIVHESTTTTSAPAATQISAPVPLTSNEIATVLANKKFSVQEDSTPQVSTLTSQTLTKSGIDQDSHPGTPSWAVTSFAQADKKRAELRKGAFSSHPPDLPPGSPPLDQENKMPNPLSVITPQRSPSHSSSAGTLGEPGPAIIPSEASSIKAHQSLRSDDQAWKRASAAAPEVVVVHDPPPMPGPPKQFVAEMEGSIPVIIKSPQTAMELEAPQQYFKLPPRPQPSIEMTPPVPHELSVGGNEHVEPAVQHQPYFVLPPRPQAPANTQTASPQCDEEPTQQKAVGLVVSGAGAERYEQIVPINDSGPVMTPVQRSDAAETGDKTIDKDKQQEIAVQDGSDCAREPQPAPQTARDTTDLATPQIPLPPSPLEHETTELTEGQEETAALEPEAGPLFLLPAVAYKAPVSPKLDLDPLQTHLESTFYVPPNLEAEASTQPSQEDTRTSPAEEIFSQHMKPSPTMEEPEMDNTVGQALQRDHKPTELKHTRNTCSHGSQNGWKAFFTGQPSPAGSNLSIRSIRRESVMEQRSSTSLGPESTSSRAPPSPGATSAKDIVWFNKPYDEFKPVSRATPHSSATNGKNGDEGLGIVMMTGNEEVKQVVSAVS